MSMPNSHSHTTANKDTRFNDVHSTGAGGSGRWSTKRIAVYALVALALSVPAALVYRKMHSRKGAVIGIVSGAILGVIAAILCNVVITPFYAHMSMAKVVAMIVPILLPFNLMKFAIHGVVTFLIYKPISTLINK